MTRSAPALLRTDDAPAPAGWYSHAAAGRGIVATAGQVGVDPATGALPEGVHAQTRRALANVAAILEAAGTDLGHVLKTTCFLARIEDFAEFDAAYAEAFGAHRPARSTVGVALAGAYLVEIEAIALVPEAEGV